MWLVKLLLKMRDQFYLILPSNSSMKYYPDNTVTHFVTQLPHSIKLPGEWAVALTEIQYPRSFMHFAGEDREITILQGSAPTSGHDSRITNTIISGEWSLVALSDNSTLNAKVAKSTIPSGIYSSITNLINAIYEDPAFDNHIKIKHNESTGGIVTISRDIDDCVVEECERHHLIYLSDKLSRVFGFQSNQLMNVHSDRVFTADFPASLAQAVPDKLFVYTDICENYITGDVQTPLLRIVPIDNTNQTYGAVQTKSFSPPNYIPLLRTEFDTIDIDIRTHTGEPVPFQSGTLTVTLHFKRIH